MHKPNHKTLGMKVAELLPSQHPDRERAKEQERGLQEFIDFFVPQTKTDIALSVLPIGAITSKASKLSKPLSQLMKKAGIEGKLQAIRDIKYRRDFSKRVASGEETEKMLSEMNEAKMFVNDWMDSQRTPSAEYLKKNIVYDKPVMKQSINSTDESLQVVEERLGLDGPFGQYSFETLEPFDSFTKVPKSKEFIKDPSELKAISDELSKLARKGDQDALDFIGFPKPSRKVTLNKSFMQDPRYALKVEREYGIPFEVYRKALLIHEYTHAITRGDKGLPKEFKHFIKMARSASKKELGARVEPGAMHYSGFQGDYKPSTAEYIKYLEKPTEVFARIMSLRYLLKETPDAITKMSRRIQPYEVKNMEPYNQLSRIFSPKQIENLYNNLPAMLPVGLYSASQIDEIAEKIDEQN